MRGTPRPTTIRSRTALLDEAMAIMEAEYASPLSVDEVAHRIATSRRQLQRCFGELHDATFRSALARVRMQRAAELLTGTALPVREVAAAVGYRQPAQFAKAFARVHGVAPSAFRAASRTAVTA